MKLRKSNSLPINFVPYAKGCAELCQIDHEQKDICCKISRNCCFFCLESCPIREEYKDLIEEYFRRESKKQLIPKNSRKKIKSSENR